MYNLQHWSRFKFHKRYYSLASFSPGGAFEGIEDQVSPFGYKRGEGIDAGAGEPEWIVNKERYKYDSIFESLGPQDGKITGAGKRLINYLYPSHNFLRIKY